MNRTLAGFSLTLMLLTGLVIGQLGTIESARKAPTSGSSAASLQGAYEFYDAINEFISTGSPTSLRSTLHPEFVDHSLYASLPATGADLEGFIDSVRLVSPGVTLSATAVLREPGFVAVTIMSKLPAGEEDVRPRLDVRGSLPAFDLLRFSGSKVIERWSFPVTPPIGRVETLATVTLGQSVPTTGFIMERFTLDQFEQLEFLHVTGIVILTESGEVTCESIATSRFEQLQETQEPCRTHLESEIIVESGRSIRLRNADPESATLVILQLRSGGLEPNCPQYPDNDSPHLGANGQALAFGPFDQEWRGPLEVVIQEVYLAPGNGIADHSVIGEEVVLTVTGEVSVSSQDGVVESLALDGNVATIRSSFTATAGNAVFAHHGSRLAYHNTSEAEAIVLVFSISPAETTATRTA